MDETRPSHATAISGPAAVGCLLPIALWTAAHRSTLAWLGDSFTMAKPLNLAMLAGVTAVLAIGLGSGFRLDGSVLRGLSFRARALPLALVLAAGLADQAARRLASFEQLSVCLLVLGTFGLLGCYLAPATWRRMLPAALLLACALPFGARFGTGLGYPARVITARLVEQVLAATDVASVSMHDVIVLENGIAHVDLPCSGLKSLWTGALFFLAASWIERRGPLAGPGLGLAWCLGFGVFQFLLFCANASRVLALVMLDVVLGQHRLASVLHVPLGAFGFLVCCAAGVVLLRLCPGRSGHGTDQELEDRPRAPSPDLPPVWVLAILVATALTMPPLANHSPIPAQSTPIGLPESIEASALALTPAEEQFFASRDGTRAGKWSFSHGALRGSALIVSTASWQTHHAPELCLAAAGIEVDGLSPLTLDDGFEVHQLTLDGGSRTAIYWFQSPRATTGSLLRRFWRDLAYRETRWVLVSILFDSAGGLHSDRLPASGRSAEPRDFLRRIHDHIDTELQPAS